MHILANVTSSLLDDYNEILRILNDAICNDDYFDVTLVTDVHSVELGDYDVFINLFDDSSDILDTYHILYDYAIEHNMRNNIISYYRLRGSYTCPDVYYVKKDVNHDRLHRFEVFESIYDIIFDIMVYAGVYYGADIGIHHGTLTFKNYSVMQLGKLTSLRRNPLLLEYEKNLELAHHDEEKCAQNGIVESKQNLLDIEDIHSYTDTLYNEYDVHLRHFIGLYAEIIRSFGNTSMSTLDYIYLKEYFRIGHLTSMTNCFNRACFIDRLHDGSMPLDDSMSILMLITYSLSFGEYNVFVKELYRKVLTLGKSIELSNKKDVFFYYHEHDFLEELENTDVDYDGLERYISTVESGVLAVNRDNMYRASIRLGEYYYNEKNEVKAKEYLEKAYRMSERAIDKCKCAKMLFDIYIDADDMCHAREYLREIMDGIHLLDNGYHNDYLAISTDLMQYRTDEEIGGWTKSVEDSVTSLRHIEPVTYYTFETRKLEESGEPIDVRIDMLKELIGNMRRDFYMSPLPMYNNIYNAYITLGTCYELAGDDNSAVQCYRSAYIYMSTLDEVDDIDERLGYVEYRIADIVEDTESAKTYRQLVRAERRLYEYIQRTHNHVGYYADVLLLIVMRHYNDGKMRSGSSIARDGMAKLDSCIALNSYYNNDAYNYASNMSRICAKFVLEEGAREYKKRADEYAKYCETSHINTKK